MFQPLPRLIGRIDYLANADRRCWGVEDWSITRAPGGERTLTAHCEMRLNDDWVIRDSTLTVDASWQPVDAYVRILNHGQLTGTGWFRFHNGVGEGESWTEREGRLSQRVELPVPLRGFGIHAVQADGWLSAIFPFDRGPGHKQRWPKNPIHSLHHLGATGPFIHTSSSGFEYLGEEEVAVPAGMFRCRRLRWIGMTNNHPAYDMWVTMDGDCLYALGVVEGYMDSRFELASLTRENGA
ncbi:MAG: hypothetical protein RQ833_10575 [Sphingomonadaceae bacterium]|nr:hypothetical protein [Sphingomonadaceae bacterium]